MIQELVDYTGRIAKIEGPARSGKTEVLIRRCTRLIRKGVDPSSILIAVSSAFAADRLRERLIHAAGDGLEDAVSNVVIARPLDVCVDLLDTPQAKEATKRIPRILTNAEYKFLLEDAKTLGQNNRRMQNMLLFFFAQWSRFEDEKQWLIPGEETDVIGYIRHMLTLYGAMLRDEVPYICARYLMSDQGLSATKHYAYVLCDDFQNLSHAEQTCMCLCAGTHLMVCGNINETTQVNTRYPFPEGFTKFDSLRKSVDVFTLTETYGSQEAIEFGEALCNAEGMDPRLISSTIVDTDAEVLTIKWNTPEEEINNTARYLASLYKRNPHLQRNRVAVVVPNKRWARLVEKALGQRGLQSSVAGIISGVEGDPRTPGQHDALTAYVKLNLIAHPQDMVAWRAWCGFDHALTNSDIWDIMQKYASEHSMSLYDTLELTATGDVITLPRTAPIKQAFKAGLQLIETYREYKGYSLFKALGMHHLYEFGALESALLGDEDARDLYELVYRSITDPRYPADSAYVHITDYENLCGLDYEGIISLGMVDGMVPHRDAFEIVSDEETRQKVLGEDRKRLYAGITKASRLLILSIFSKAGIEIAERTKMQVSRITSEEGERIALLKRSVFFQESGAACPSTVGGEDIMSELLLN